MILNPPPSRTELLERDRNGQPTGNMGAVWVKYIGQMYDAVRFLLAVPIESTVSLTVADVNALAPGPADAGRIFPIAVYNHRVRWTGTVFEFAAGDAGSDWFAMRPTAPQEAGWQLCDGTATDYLVVGGVTLTTAPFTTPVVTDQYFRR